MAKLKNLVNHNIKNGVWISAILTAIISLTYLNVTNITLFPHDSSYYWTIADSCFDGSFNILAFPETFRGYLFPLILGLLKHGGECVLGERGGIQLYRILVAVLLAAFISFTLPSLFDRKIESIADIARQIVLLFVILFYWGDFFSYPLSDFFALFFMTCAVTLGKNLLQKDLSIRTWGESIGLGILLYSAYNIRAAYLYGIVAYLIYVLVHCFKKRKVRHDMLIGVLVGTIIVAMPQVFINHQYVGKYSPKVYTEQLFGYNADLQKTQVLWGLNYTNYETNIGPYDEYPDASVIFFDEVGIRILEREGVTIENFSYIQFIRLFFKYPFDFISIYTRHFVTLMTPKFQEIYITNMYPEKGGFVALILLIWFVALVSIIRSMQLKNDKKTLVLALILCVPAALQMAGAPEIRFFLMIHMLGYYYTICYIDYRELCRDLKKYAFPIVVAFILFSFLWISVVGSILSSDQHETLLIDDKNIYREKTVD